MHLELKTSARQQRTKRRWSRKPRWTRTVIDFVESYFRQSATHGWLYLVKRHLALSEKCLWLLLILASVYSCISIGLEALDRFHTKSTVVGLERDYYYRNTSLPSVTACPWQRLQMHAFYAYCRENKIFGSHLFEFYNFIHSLANATYSTFASIPSYPNIDTTLDRLHIQPAQYMELIYNLTGDHSYTDVIEQPSGNQHIYAIHDQFFIHTRQVLTELGLCYLANNKLDYEYSSRYFIFGQYPANNYSKVPLKAMLKRNHFEQDTEFSLKGFSNEPVTVFVHSYYEVMQLEHYHVVLDDMRFDTEVIAIDAEQDFEKHTTPSQRKCRFQHESNLNHFPIYTKTLCLQECRLELVYRTCQCIPHFYPNRFGTPKPVCHYQVMRDCLAKYENLFVKLYVDTNDTGSKYDFKTWKCVDSCLQNCVDSIVNIKEQKTLKRTQLLLGGSGIIIGMSVAPKTLLKRKIIYSLTNLLVSIGGAASLFLGFSVLGAIEIFYFFTLRLIWYMRGYRYTTEVN